MTTPTAPFLPYTPTPPAVLAAEAEAAARRRAAYRSAAAAVEALRQEAAADPQVTAAAERVSRLTTALDDARTQHRQAGEDANRHSTAVRASLADGQDPDAAESDRDRATCRQATYAVRIGELTELAVAAERELAAAKESTLRTLAVGRHPDAAAAAELAGEEVSALKQRHASELAAAEVKVADAESLARELAAVAWPTDGYERDWLGRPPGEADPGDDDDADDDPLDLADFATP